MKFRDLFQLDRDQVNEITARRIHIDAPSRFLSVSIIC